MHFLLDCAVPLVVSGSAQTQYGGGRVPQRQ
nr:MAG TPA: hypothetical protein [Caudoviricetes sp.]DAU73529.1 MAG TPA: hypothetical protein [Caudoviricetes sp.]